MLSNKDAEVIIKSQLKWKEDDKITKQVKEPIKKETIKSEETQTTIKKESKIQHVKKEKALTEDFFYDTQQ
ncbi:MAG: hypothetical protein KJ886_03475, partial [Candidatus Thermoplasmatota archaeon]|nr:hypothetical protein [Candidatus Thermoplasmatota archaeon]